MARRVVTLYLVLTIRIELFMFDENKSKFSRSFVSMWCSRIVSTFFFYSDKLVVKFASIICLECIMHANDQWIRLLQILKILMNIFDFIFLRKESDELVSSDCSIFRVFTVNRFFFLFIWTRNRHSFLCSLLELGSV